MNKEDKNLNFKVNSKNNAHLQHHKREKLKIKLMEKYSISSQEAEHLIEKIINNEKEKEKKKQSVDNLLENIIPDYQKNVSIEVNHVDLTFEVLNEKVDTLKESFIRTIQRKKTKKIKVHALKDVSFKIYKGEKVGIIGYNGAGKSTLLSVITGIYLPNKGFVKTNGNISPLLSLGAGFDFNYSGRQNIFLNGAVLGYKKEFLESKVDEIIEFSELGQFIDIPIKNYSSGMLAKLGFSIATAVNPDILIIDEILGVGDVNFQKKSSDKIRSLMDGGTTVLLVSHSIPQIRELCDKAIWIDNGNLKEFGDVNKVCDHYLKDAEKASNEQLANIQFR
ncbi:MAG: ABC transporter ATP-binding protein [Methanobrevibacter sp.]|uniref:ABC transporter ATP-binding protein n=1 Tax=Methanobrevibacter sp. TaxID=66852 RepID=UPI002E79B5E0|nr:ABC transporter ATP-binding protein [Methanobrevibacter sp.]MEE0935869.1 ABC transporter ATP-binding protein [Methanobrevibacter sp.]